MGRGVRLSTKHGVNPTVGVCFWCGEDDGTVALLGRLPGDREAGRRTVLGYEPCEKCEEQWKTGVLLIEITEHPTAEGQPQINSEHDPHSLYPTGCWSVVTDVGAGRVFTADVLPDVLRKRKAYISADAYAMIGLSDPGDREEKQA